MNDVYNTLARLLTICVCFSLLGSLRQRHDSSTFSHFDLIIDLYTSILINIRHLLRLTLVLSFNLSHTYCDNLIAFHAFVASAFVIVIVIAISVP